MFAVIKTGGKQYRVAANDTLQVEKLAGEPGETIALSDVLMLGGDGEPKVGLPMIAGASVSAEILEHGRGDKVIIFKKRRRQNSRRKNGHRQDYTLIKITEILTEPKAKPARKAKAKPASEDKAETAPTPDAAPVEAAAKKPRTRRAPAKSTRSTKDKTGA